MTMTTTETAAASKTVHAVETTPSAHELSLQLAEKDAEIATSETRIYLQDDARTREAHNKLLEEREVIAAKLRAAQRIEQERATKLAASEKAEIEAERDALLARVDHRAMWTFADTLAETGVLPILYGDGSTASAPTPLVSLIQRIEQRCADALTDVRALENLVQRYGLESPGTLPRWRIYSVVDRIARHVAARRKASSVSREVLEVIAEMVNPSSSIVPLPPEENHHATRR